MQFVSFVYNIIPIWKPLIKNRESVGFFFLVGIFVAINLLIATYFVIKCVNVWDIFPGQILRRNTNIKIETAEKLCCSLWMVNALPTHSLQWRHNVRDGANQGKHQSSASLAFVRRIHRWPITRKICPFDDVIVYCVEIITYRVWDQFNCAFIFWP